MRALEDCKRYEVQTDNGWVPVRWEQLDVGDIVRAFHPDGTPETDPMVPLHMTISELPHLRVLTVDEVAVHEVTDCCKASDVDGALKICFTFLEKQVAAKRFHLVCRFLGELSTYVWMPIQSQALPVLVMVGVLRGTFRIKDELGFYWTNFRSLTIDRIKSEKGDVDRILRGLL
jgi:hypothetical protein